MKIQMFAPIYDVENCILGIRECLEKGWTGKGYKTLEFEEEWKKFTNLSHAHFLTSGTAGLNLAVETLKEENSWVDDDEIITTPLTFVATNNSILFAKLKPIFADVDDTLCLNPASVRKSITSRTRAVMFVGLGGNVGNYLEIVQICQEYGLKLILDAAHMAGTRLQGQIPGREADAVVYSFHVTKNLSTAESGILCFKDSQLDQIVRDKSFNGIAKSDLTVQSFDNNMGDYYVKYLSDAYNGNSIMAAIALAQLPHLDAENAIRRVIAQKYNEKFKLHPDKIGLISVNNDCESAQWLYQIVISDRNGLMAYLRTQGIECGIHYPDNTLYKMYYNQNGMCPTASYYSRHLLTLPLHIKLTDEDIDFITTQVLEYLDSDYKH